MSCLHRFLMNDVLPLWPSYISLFALSKGKVNESCSHSLRRTVWAGADLWFHRHTALSDSHVHKCTSGSSCQYSPVSTRFMVHLSSLKGSPPLTSIKLYCLATKAHGCKQCLRLLLDSVAVSLELVTIADNSATKLSSHPSGSI